MGNISVTKLAGLSIILGPILGLIGYFLAPASSVINPVDPTNAIEVISAVNGNAALALITGIVIMVGLIMMLNGIRYLASGMKGGAGEAFSGYILTLVSIGIIGYLLTVALNWTIAGADLTGADAAAAATAAGADAATAGAVAAATAGAGFAAAGAAFAVGQGINTLAALVFATGFLLLSFFIAQAGTYNKIFAYIASVAAIVMVVTTILGATDTFSGETGALIGGICFIVFTVWAITVGREILTSSE